MTGLVADGVSKVFGGIRALREVSVSVEPGEIVGLIGPNGSGKTTLLNVISGIFRPDTGAVKLEGTRIDGLSAHRIAEGGIARTFQSIRLFRDLSVLENVQVGAVASQRHTARSGRRTALAVLDEAGIGDMVYQKPEALPHGAQRRLEMARALASRPRYLLLDEPAAGMNEAESDGLLESIAATVDRLGLGLLIIDHDLRLIMRLCHRVVVLNSGEVIAEGTPDVVEANPAVAEAYLGRRHAHPGLAAANSSEAAPSAGAIRAASGLKPEITSKGEAESGEPPKEGGS